jgi:hypothetical protein
MEWLLALTHLPQAVVAVVLTRLFYSLQELRVVLAVVVLLPEVAKVLEVQETQEAIPHQKATMVALDTELLALLITAVEVVVELELLEATAHQLLQETVVMELLILLQEYQLHTLAVVVVELFNLQP